MRDTSARDTNPDVVSLVAPVRSKVMEILASEAEDGILRYSDDGMSMYDGGWWKASIWNPRIGGSSIDLACRPVGGRWEVTVAPNDPDWPCFVIAWPSDTFDAALHASIAILRT